MKLTDKDRLDLIDDAYRCHKACYKRIDEFGKNWEESYLWYISSPQYFEDKQEGCELSKYDFEMAHNYMDYMNSEPDGADYADDQLVRRDFDF